MNTISPLAILLFGIALGACLPILVTTLHAWLRHKRFKPTLLRLDDTPARRVPPSAPPGDGQP